jgi:hypothetical protein
MKKSELNNKSNHLLNEFETLDNIEFSPEWNAELMSKITSIEKDLYSKLSSTKYVMLLILFVLVNVGFTFNLINKKSKQDTGRYAQLQMVSKELLINLNSQNN